MQNLQAHRGIGSSHIRTYSPSLYKRLSFMCSYYAQWENQWSHWPLSRQHLAGSTGQQLGGMLLYDHQGITYMDFMNEQTDMYQTAQYIDILDLTYKSFRLVGGTRPYLLLQQVFTIIVKLLSFKLLFLTSYGLAWSIIVRLVFKFKVRNSHSQREHVVSGVQTHILTLYTIDLYLAVATTAIHQQHHQANGLF